MPPQLYITARDPAVENEFTYNADGLRTTKTVTYAQSAAAKDGLYWDKDGEIRYYDNGFACYMGLICVNGGYYYINSSKTAVRGRTYATTCNNGLLPNGTYTFGEDGRIIDPPTNATVGTVKNAPKTKDSTSSVAITAGSVTATTQYHYVGDTLAGMTCGNDELYFVYDVLGPSAVIYNGTTYYYVRNAQGDITHIYNSSGTKVVSYTYDAWGNAISITGSMMTTLGALNPLRYRGYVYDSETGLYYLQSRYYNPSWGRFINADRLVDKTNIVGTNLFAYCSNNPTNKQDSTGNLGIGTIAGAITGALIGGISGAVSAAIKGTSVWASAAAGAATGALLGVICGSIADSFYTAGTSLTVTTVAVGLLKGSVLSGITAFTMNALTQEVNYSIDKRNATNNAVNDETLPSEFPTWDEYYDMDSALRSGIGAAIFAPLSIGGGYAAGAAAAGDVLGDIMGNIIISADISVLQSIIELF